MKTNMLHLLILLMGFNFSYSLLLNAQSEEEEIIDFDEDIDEEEVRKKEEEKKRLEEEKKKREEEEQKKRREEEERKLKEEKLKQVKARRASEEAKKKEQDGLREASADTTEYTIDPSSVELLVELEPNAYGFRQRNHRATLSTDVDFLFRGRSFLRLDFRFFEYLSFGINGGFDWSQMSLFDKFRRQMNTSSPSQFAILAGLDAKMRLTEWYMRSSAFIETSFLFGRLWQDLLFLESKHWRIRPGIFLGLESVFDSGFTLSTKLGAEMPFDFGTPNPWKETVDPLLLIGFGLSI